MREPLPDFSALSPMFIADAVEAVIGAPVEGSLTPMPSYVNRVYGLSTTDGRRVIAKFYRPGRWSEGAIREEHSFMAECAAADLPVVAPIPDADGDTLSALAVEDESSEEKSFLFALFPFVAGRGWEAESDDDWLALGGLIASIHEVGRRYPAPERSVLTPANSTRPALRRLVDGNFIHPDVRDEFEDACASTLERIDELFAEVTLQRIHGDLHRGNLFRTFHRDSSGSDVLLIDFDDMAMGPAIQDLWLLLPGRLSDSRGEFGLLAEGYERVLHLDGSARELIEPLRFMRMISYLGWQARQCEDEGFYRAFPDWGSRSFWIKELEDLRDQIAVLSSRL